MRNEILDFTKTTLRVMDGLDGDKYENIIQAFKAESDPPGSDACSRVTVYDEDGNGCGKKSADQVSYYGDFDWQTLPDDLYEDSSCFDVHVNPPKTFGPECIFTGTPNTPEGNCLCQRSCDVTLHQDTEEPVQVLRYFERVTPETITAKDGVTQAPARFSDNSPERKSAIGVLPGAGCQHVALVDGDTGGFGFEVRKDVGLMDKTRADSGISYSDNVWLESGMYAHLEEDCDADHVAGDGGKYCCKNNNGNCRGDLNKDVGGVWVKPKGTAPYKASPPSPASPAQQEPDGIPPLFTLGVPGTDLCPSNYTHVLEASMCMSALSDHQNSFGWNKCGATASWPGSLTNWADGMDSLYDIRYKVEETTIDRRACQESMRPAKAKANHCHIDSIRRKQPGHGYDATRPTGCYLDQDSVLFPASGADAPSMKVRFNSPPPSGTNPARPIAGEYVPLCIAVGWDYIIPYRQQCEVTLLDDFGDVISSRMYDKGEFSSIITAESEEEGKVHYVDVSPMCGEVILGDADGACAKSGDNTQ